jgi:predicted Zn-dependent protease
MRDFSQPLLHWLLLVAMLALPVSLTHALNTELPELGNSAGSLMTPKREQELGRAFMRSVRRTQNVMDDPLLADYIQSLGKTLVRHSTASGSPFSFFMIDSPQINAFAGPGGHIGVYTGLLLTTETESELAAVVAHEIAHVSQQHLMRTWEATSRFSVPQAAVLLAAAVLGATVGGDAAAAAAIGSQAAMVQQRINFTRANEKEADRVGIDILAESGFEPRAMPTFFARMGKANRVYATQLPELLMTHPVTTSRTADSMGRAEQFPYRQAPDSLRYQLARANLMQRRIEEPQQAVRELALMLEDGRFRSQAATQYGIALAQLRANQFDEAAKTLDGLLADHPDTIEFIVTRARVDSAKGRHAEALVRLRDALVAHPGSFAINLSFADIALAGGQPQAALEALSDFLSYRDDEPRIYQLLSQAAGDLDRQALGHEYLAEYYYLRGQTERAALQIEIALKQPGLEFFDASRLESRLNALNQELDEADRRRRPGS